MYQLDGDSTRTELTNTIVVQNDKTIQEIWDVARKLNCEWIDNYVKTINFNPFTVGMLETQEVRFQGDRPIECWMDLQLGKYPDISDINSIVKIGDMLSLLVYARDNDYQYDVAVKDCYAFAGSDYDNPNTPRLQLTDVDGCVIKDKLISSFYTAREEDDRGSVIVAYAFVHAFKFPDVMDVYMTCNVEVCKGDCDSKCSNNLIEPTTTEPPRRWGSTLFGEPIYTTKPACHPGSNDPRCSTTPSPCYPGSKDPACIPEKCYPGSKDPECSPPEEKTGKAIFPDLNTVPPPPTTTPKCYPGSRKKGCPVDCLLDPLHPLCPTTTTPRPETTTEGCYPGSLNPNCVTVPDDRRYGSILFPATITTTPSTTTTTKKSGGLIFPNVIEPTTTKAAPRLKPKTTTQKTPNKGKQLIEPQSKPEPSGKEWEGEARYHAFHKFHYQRGDGRRSRIFGRRLASKNRKVRRVTRSVVKEIQVRPFVGKMPIKLSKGLSVAAPSEIVPVTSLEHSLQSHRAKEMVCMSHTAVIAFSILLFLLVISLAVFLFLYIRSSRNSSRKTNIER